MSPGEFALAIGFASVLLLVVFARHKSSVRRKGATMGAAYVAADGSGSSGSVAPVCDAGIAGSGACDSVGDGGGGGGGGD